MLLLAALVAATVVLGCSDYSTATKTGSGSTLQVVNATRAPLTITVDGVRVATGLSISGLSVRNVGPGAHAVRLEATGSPAKDFTINATLGVAVTAVVQASIEGALIPSVLADTAATPAPGKSKLRVIHLSALAPAIDPCRTPPGFRPGRALIVPFLRRGPGHPKSNAAGTWTVYVTPVGDANTKLAESGPIVAASGEVRTVVLVDSAGALRLRFTNDRGQ